MRTEKEMLELIIGTAAEDPRIRAVGLNGSRANPRAVRDKFQDYDIVYFVSDLESFLAAPGWIDVFGPRIIMQEPEDAELFEPSGEPGWAYLMLFEDGNRIDLTLKTAAQAESYLRSDSEMVILLDKDGLLPYDKEPDDSDYWVKRPTAGNFRGVCNEFWWVSAYVAKGLWRGELLYALDHLHNYVRRQLHQMLAWQAGCETNFRFSMGKSEKYLPEYLDPEVYRRLLLTWGRAEPKAIWDALFLMTELFSQAAGKTASCLGFAYEREEESKVLAYLNRVRSDCEESQETVSG